MWELACVGAGLVWEPGLPAMQAPRCISYTAVMLSQASQLPHKPSAHLLFRVSQQLQFD